MMDQLLLSDALECSVCLEQLGATSRVLPCQHTFCRRCLNDIVDTHKELRCPECRVLVEQSVDELPPNILLMRILESMKSPPRPPISQHTKPCQTVPQPHPAQPPGRLLLDPADGPPLTQAPLPPTHYPFPTSLSFSGTDSTHGFTGGGGGGGGVVLSGLGHHGTHTRGTTLIGTSMDSYSGSLGRDGHGHGHRQGHGRGHVSGGGGGGGIGVGGGGGGVFNAVVSGISVSSLGSNLSSGSIHHPLSNQPQSQSQSTTQPIQPTALPLLTHQRQTTLQPCAKALYNYERKEPRDLSFKKGDVIILRKKIDSNWYQGEINNHLGFFPASYVQVITPLPSHIPQCKALYDFKMTNDEERDCLTFNKGEILTVLRRVDENWAEGKLGARIGIFPLSFVDLNSAAKALMKFSLNAQQGPSRVAPPTPTRLEGEPATPLILNEGSGGHPPSSQSQSQSHSQHPNPNLPLPIDSSSSSSSIVTSPDPSLTSPTTSASPPNNNNNSNNNNNNNNISSLSPFPSPSPSSSSSPMVPQSSSSSSSSSAIAPPPPPPSLLRGSSKRYQKEKRHSFTSVRSAAQNQSPPCSPASPQRHSVEIVSPSEDSNSIGNAVIHANGDRTHHTPITTSTTSQGYVGIEETAGDMNNATTITTSTATSTTTAVTATATTTTPTSTTAAITADTLGSPRMRCGLHPVLSGASTSNISTIVSTSTSSTLSNTTSSYSSSSTTPQVSATTLYVALYSYRGRKPDELELKKGHIYTVTEKCQDGWFKGRCITTDRTGVFPGNYVQVAKPQMISAYLAKRNARMSSNTGGDGSGSGGGSGGGGGGGSSQSTHSSSGGSTPQMGVVSYTRPRPSLGVGQDGRTLDIGPRGENTSLLDTPVLSKAPTLSPTHSSSPHAGSLSPGVAGVLIGGSSPCLPPELPPRSISSGTEASMPHRTSGLTTSSSSSSSSSWHPTQQTTPQGFSVTHRSVSGISSAVSPPPNIALSDTGTVIATTSTTTTTMTMTTTTTTTTSARADRKSAKDRGGGSCGGSGISLMRKLASSGKKKSKSPPPSYSMDNPVFEDSTVVSSNVLQHVHTRSGSNPDTSGVGIGVGVSSSPASSSPPPPQPQPPSSQTITADPALATDTPRRKKQPVPLVRERFRCIVPYPPNSEYELELQLGDIIYVHKKRDDGWYKGTLQRTGKTGLFPASFVDSY